VAATSTSIAGASGSNQCGTCWDLRVSASPYHERASSRRSLRAVEDERLQERIRELHASNYYAYGYRRTRKRPRRGPARAAALPGAAADASERKVR